MKKKTAVWLTAAACAVSLLPLTGCGGKETPRSLAAAAAENLDKMKSASLNMAMEFDVVLDMSELYEEGDVVSMEMAMDLDIDTTVEPKAAYLQGTVGVSAAGERTEQEMETWLVEEDGQMVSYALTDGTSLRKVSEEDGTGVLQKDMYEAIAAGEMEAELEEEMAMIDRRNVYVLRSTLRGELLQDSISFSLSGSGMTAGGDVDWGNAEAPVRIYIFQDTKMPARVRMDCSELGEVMMAATYGNSGISVEVNEFEIELDFDGYDQVGAIEVPSYVRDNAVDVDAAAGGSAEAPEEDAEDAEDYPEWDTEESAWPEEEPEDGGTEEMTPDDGERTEEELEDEEAAERDADGNYILRTDDGTHSAVITMMDDQEYSFSDETYLYTTEAELQPDSDEYSYQFIDYYTLEEIAEDRADCSWMEDYEEYSNIVPGQVQELEAGGKTVYWVKNTYDFGGGSGYDATRFIDIYGWTQVGDVLFEITINSYGEAPDTGEDQIREAFERVELS